MKIKTAHSSDAIRFRNARGQCKSLVFTKEVSVGVLHWHPLRLEYKLNGTQTRTGASLYVPKDNKTG